jgi:putative nucleotidyltransferase-like protein
MLVYLKRQPNITGERCMRILGTLPTQVVATMTRPEVALLLCCARARVDAESAEQMSTLLQQHLDWPFLMQTALQHGVMPLLYQHLSTMCPEAIPTAALKQLREHFHRNAGYNLFLTRELLMVLHLLETHGIPALPFKGPTLAAFVYGHLALRQFGDLDILVHKQDIQRTKDLLTTHGYQLPLTRVQEEAILKYHYHYAFVRHDGRVHVEMHWAFTRRYWPVPLDFSCLWAHRTTLSLEGTTVSVFSPEELLLILCVHGSKDHWSILKWVCDVADLLRIHPTMDWGWVMERARTSGGIYILLLGLTLAHTLMGAVLPQEVVHRIQAAPVVSALATQVRTQLCARLNGLPWKNDWHTFNLRVRERVQDRVRYFLFGYLRECCQPLFSFPQLITPNAQDHALLTLPPQCAFFYYLFRPARLIVVHGLRLVTFLFKHLAGL